MARGYTVGIGSETKAFKQGVESGIIDPLEDAQKELLDLGKNRGLDQLEDGMRDAQRATDKLKDEVEDTANAIEKEFKTAYRKAKESAQDGMDGASEASSEFKDELKSNFSEITSSFDGSMNSIQDLAQGTLGGLASTDIPGIGIAAGIAAAGIGLIGSAFQSAEEERQLLEERASDLAQAYIEAGETVLDAMTVADRSADVLTDETKRKEAEKLVEVLGIEMSQAVRIVAQDEEALRNAQVLTTAATAEANEKLAEATRLSKEGTTQSTIRAGELTAEADALLVTGKALDKYATIQDTASESAKVHSDLLKSLIKEAESATEEVDEFGNKLITLPDGTKVVIEADTGNATVNVDKFKGDVDGIPEIVTTTAKLVVDDWNLRSYRPPTIYIPGRVVMPSSGREIY